MNSFKVFLGWYNKKRFCANFKSNAKKIDFFYHDKEIVMLKLGCTLPNLANICLHKSTDANFHPLKQGDEDLLEKVSEDVFGGLSLLQIYSWD